MGANLVNLNVNPCKMCMPMGAVTAFCGIKKCMTILHGSQGCSTYIRRHMATHYNEPVDIASSSLTEQGTVFGGENNLLKGLDNLIELYNPEIIGVATTCLAETIGEDVESIIKKYYSLHPKTSVKIINVASAGYGGTQYEGFLKALKAIVSSVEMDTTPNEKINIITSNISTADTRYLKFLLDSMGIDYILLPDLSETLDGVHVEKYDRLKNEGTSLEDISKMAGAKLTIELSTFIDSTCSPAEYLEEEFGVPFKRLNLPIGIRDTDKFIEALVEVGAVKLTELIKERGRYIDAMVDSHKYCAQGRAVIFGEPDFVYSMTRLCCENGVVPVVVATGSVCKSLKPMLEEEIKECADTMLIEKTVIVDDCDFDTIESLALELKANVMIGSSEGRRISHKHNIDLVRCAFPIHDRVGGQRIRTLGYEGSLSILDQIANILLGNKEENYKLDIYNQHFKNKVEEKEGAKIMEKSIEQMVAEKTATHPCYNCQAGKYARIHLPVAPKCNIQCNYCVRKYDCPNESRPGVTTEILSPKEAFKKFAIVKGKMDNLTVVGIAGPGDALANFEETKKTLQLIKEYDPKVTFCLSTNGLMLPFYAQEIIDFGVSHVTITINAVDTKIGEKIYKFVNYMGTKYTGETAAAILLANQLSGLKYLASRGIICKVNTVVLKGINDNHIEEVVKKVKELGAYITNIMQLIPVAGSEFEDLGTVSNKEIMEIRKFCEKHIKQMYHCKQCRADAIGTLDNDLSIEYRGCSKDFVPEKIELPTMRFAVVSKSGMLVDQHFGQADEFLIYESNGKNSKFVEKRSVDKYCEGQENCDEKSSKINRIITAVSDCKGVLALRIGDAPSEKLKEKGINVFSTYDRIEDAVKKAATQVI